MSDEIGLRRVFPVGGVAGNYKFTVSAFTGPYAFVVNVDPAHLLAVTTHKAGRNREPVGAELQSYRLGRLFDQADQCPVVMPTVALSYHEKDKGTLFDAPLVRECIGRGVSAMPVMIQGSESEVKDFLAAHKISATPEPLENSRPVLTFKNHGQPDSIGGEYTTAFSMDEMAESIDSRVRTANARNAFVSASNKDCYRPFPQCQDALEVLVATGCQYLAVDRYWDGESILQSMKSQLSAYEKRIGEDNVSAIELVDRFSLLNERNIVRTGAVKDSYMQLIDPDADARLDKLSSIIATRMAMDKDALRLASENLSGSAKEYLQDRLQSTGQGVNAAPVLGPR